MTFVFTTARGRLRTLVEDLNSEVVVVLLNNDPYTENALRGAESLADALAVAPEHPDSDRPIITLTTTTTAGGDVRFAADPVAFPQLTGEAFGGLILAVGAPGDQDTDRVPLTHHTVTGTPNGEDVTVTFDDDQVVILTDGS